MSTYTINNTALTFDKVIYVNSTTGSNSNDGLTSTAPKQTVAGAYAILHSHDNAIVLANGTYDFAAEICTNTCHRISFIGNGLTVTMRNTGGIYSDNSGNPGTANIDFYDLVWDGNNLGSANNYISIVTMWRFYNVVFKNTASNNYAYFLLYGTAKNTEAVKSIEMYNCIKATSSNCFLRSDMGTIHLTNCYGAFTSGYSTTQASWDYHTNRIVSSPSLDASYNITEAAQYWKNVGTGLNTDGTVADLGVYGGDMTWNFIPPLPSYGDASAYYVSQQHGSDSNDGLSEATAWATLTKAAQYSHPKAGQDVYIYVAPGTYRERVDLTTGGVSSSERLLFFGDPNCTHFPNDHPGIVRVTKTNESDLITATTGINTIYFHNQQYTEFQNMHIDGAAIDAYAVVGSTTRIGTVLRNCIISGRYGLNSVDNYNCKIFSAFVGCYNCNNYNSICIGGTTGFSGGIALNCLSFGGSNPFYNSRNYNCLAIGSSSNPFPASNNYNCWQTYCYGNPASGVVATGASYPHILFDINLVPIIYKGLMDAGSTTSTGIPTIPATDFIDVPRVGGNNLIDIGPLELPDYTIDWATFNANAPSIKINRKGTLKFTLQAVSGSILSKQVYVKFGVIPPNQTAIKPSITIKGPGVTTAEVTAQGDGTNWEILTLSVTPTVTGVYSIYLNCNDPGGYVYFSDLS